MIKKFLRILLILFVSLSIVWITNDAVQRYLGIKIIQFETPNTKNTPTLPEDATAKLLVKTYKNDIETYQKEVFVRIITNKPVRLVNTKNTIILQTKNKDMEYHHVIKIGNLGTGNNSRKIQIQAYDKDVYESLETDIKNFNIADVVFNINKKNGYLLNFDDKVSFILDPNDLTANVSRHTSIPTDYEPSDLVDLNKDKLLYTNVSNIMLRTEAADALVNMLNVLKKETGKNLVIASGYRSYLQQEEVYSYWVKQLGITEAEKISAKPGQSEHQLGTTVDFFSEDSGFEFTNKFADTVAGKWLQKNSYKFGFIQSYPVGKEELTGYNAESWHYRYIGINNAMEYMKFIDSMTLNEFLDKIQEQDIVYMQ